MTLDPPAPLTTADHRRNRLGLTYVYPVVSRRSGGLSVGVNLNPNHACNWRCIYCQVPGLVRGTAPPIDLVLLERELAGLLEDALRGDYLARNVPADMRRLADIALSGDGEPTSAREFDRVVEVIGRVRRTAGVPAGVKTVLITNGSLVQRPEVRSGLRTLATLEGEVWFKLDRATAEGIRAVNDVSLTPEAVRRNLETAARLCPTRVQTCVFALDGAPPSDDEVEAYLAMLRGALHDGVPLRGVFLYGLARPSMQPEAPRLSAVPADWLDAFAERVRVLGLPVTVVP
ncbi:MAG TPA: radical SAM protein [Candidatus Limnocylindria bacterium]|nr:radical SAM protein [Candidatus Limnocylindria bacterium]